MKISRKLVVGIALLFIVILVLSPMLPLMVYGVPGVSIHQVRETKPQTMMHTIAGAYGSFIALEFSKKQGMRSAHTWDWYGRELTLQLNVKLTGKIEVTSILSPRFLTEIKPSPFLIEETETELTYRNITIHAYCYSFKLTTAWSGTAEVRVIDKKEWGIFPPFVPIRSFEDMATDILRDVLIPAFNENPYIRANILLSIDAPALGTDIRYTLNPDYVGVFGMWLQDYKIEGYAPGTAAEAQPQATGTPIHLYLDRGLKEKCWGVAGPTDVPLITPNVTYWFDHLAPHGAYWATNVINLGSTLLFDSTKMFPNYVSWAYETAGLGTAPCIAQIFRIDLGFRVYEDFIVPKIPLYELSEEEKEKQRIIIEAEPENLGTPRTSPTIATWIDAILKLMPIFIALIIMVTVIIVVYLVLKMRRGT